MSKIIFNPAGVSNVSSQLSRRIVQVSDTKSALSNLRYSIDSKVISRRGIGSRLNNSVNTLSEIEAKLKAIRGVLDFAHDRYINAEKIIS